jgi:DNA polymerase III subunit epsilon
MTEQGQVSLVNYPAKALLGSERVRVGTSVFAALERDRVIAALARARQEGGTVEAMLRTVDGAELPARIAGLDEHGGAVLSFNHDLAEHRAELDHDLALHDRPPARVPLSDDTRMAELHATVVDTETTGLTPAVDRVVSIGAVRVCGGRLYRGMSFDRLVRPGVPIPARSTAVHGITDAMVADAAAFPAVFADFAPLARDTVWIGHNVAFDVAMLRQECALAGLSWEEPAALDTLLLAASLKLGLPGLSLENLAAHFSVDIRGRHTALGDALVTAEVYVAMLPLLAEAGVGTLGEALRFSRRAKGVIARQKAAGW